MKGPVENTQRKKPRRSRGTEDLSLNEVPRQESAEEKERSMSEGTIRAHHNIAV